MIRHRLHRPWMADEDARLRHFFEKGLTATRIAYLMKRSAAGVTKRARELGVKKHRPKLNPPPKPSLIAPKSDD